MFKKRIKKRDEGIIKFQCNWNMSGVVLTEDQYKEINLVRELMHKRKYIGIYPDRIGYGNLSIRTEEGFIISGSATGGIQNLYPGHYSLVTSFNVEENAVECKGPLKASSESLSHGVIYNSIEDVGAVLHIHNKALWDKYKDDLPTTSSDVLYGTPAMADEVIRLLGSMENEGVFIMGGHEEGIVSYGKTIEEAADLMLDL